MSVCQHNEFNILETFKSCFSRLRYRENYGTIFVKIFKMRYLTTLKDKI